MKNILRFFAVIVAVVMAIGVMDNPTTQALVTGNNTLVNYDSTGTTTSSGGNQTARISEDGRYVAWTSSTTNIVSGSTYSGIYQRDMQTGIAKHVSLKEDGTPVWALDTNFAMSRTGRYIVFQSAANDIVTSPKVTSSSPIYHLYLTDTQLGTTKLVDQSVVGVVANASSESIVSLSVTDDGRYVLFRSQANNLLSSGNPTTTTSFNVYLKDMKTGTVINPIVSASGARADSTVGRAFLSCDGSLLIFSSSATNLTPESTGRSDTYAVDLRNGFSITTLASTANAGTGSVSLSCNGRYVVLSSLATNLTSDSVTGNVYHYFRYDRLTDQYELVDKAGSGYISTQNPVTNTWGNSNIVSDTGKVLFRSADVNLVSPAATSTAEFYIRNPELNTTEILRKNSSGQEQNASSTSNQGQVLEINARGDRALFNSLATNILPAYGGCKLVLGEI